MNIVIVIVINFLMENNIFNYFSNEDILFSSRDQKLTNIHSMKYKKVMALNHKKPILYKKVEFQNKKKDYTNIKDLLKCKHHQSSIRNVFNSFFRNSQSQEPHQKSKVLPLQNSTNQLSINININNIQNYNVSTKHNKINNSIKFPLVLKHSIMTPSFQKNNMKGHKLQLDRRFKINSLSKMNIFKGKDNESLEFNPSKKSKVIDDNNEDSVIDELVDLLERVEGTNQTTKKDDETGAVETIYPKMTNQTRPQTSYGGLQLRQRQLQKSASCRLPIQLNTNKKES